VNIESPEKAKSSFKPRQKRRRKRRIIVKFIFLILLFSLVIFVIWELRTSWLQAKCFTAYASKLTFRMEPGPSPSIQFPQTGPYDQRLGYSHLGNFTDNLTQGGYGIESQARFSPRLLDLAGKGFFTTYHEKTQAGLRILDRNNEDIFSACYPERVYKTLDSVPDLIVRTLLFIENRELLDPNYPYRNPAVEWDRFAKAIFDMAVHTVYKDHKVTGGSTMATQLEKYRHSPEGRTSEAGEKMRQMVSAALRAYLNGEETTESRRQLVVDYINSVPLAALPGYGEVNSLGDGLWAWYGADFDLVNQYLAGNASDQNIEERALAYKQVLSLFLAHRRPSFYLVENQDALESLTNRYLVILSEAGIISPAMRNAALRADLKLRESAPPQPEVPFLERKASNAIRTSLSALLGIPHLYDLDRLDLTISSTIDDRTQQDIMKVLQQLNDPDYANSVGMVGHRLLSQDRSSGLIYSFTLYEHVGNANLLRVQADSFDQPLNINEGVKLELGSTAKLRTLITYLEILADLHKRYSGLSREELNAIHAPRSDRLSQWAIMYLSTAPDKSLKAMMKSAMERRYSASPGETFFTGGGQHTFVNFENEHDGRIPTVQEALQESINLAFIRIMRDIINYYMYQVPGSTARLLEDMEDPRRKVYLSRFADQEGRLFLSRFYNKYKGKGSQEMMDLLIQGVRPTPVRLAVIFRSVKPEASAREFNAFMHAQLYDNLSEDEVNDLYEKYSKSKFNLADRGYIARIHPLELWTVEYLLHHHGANYSDVIKNSANERQAVYAWLFKTTRKHAQDIRIRTIIEMEAFQEIHRAWKRLGYPFDFLVPSYATAIGSSADRPAALADLVGIILNNGVRYPSIRMQKLHFAEGTPYEVILQYNENAGEQVLQAEIAEVVKGALIGVVEKGTGRRAYRAFRRSDGTAIIMGGKTGTGDNRREIYGRGGRLIESKVMSRTATFVFLIGDRFFGTVTAYVAGPEAAGYKFTSTLPVQLIKVLAPKLMPLVEEKTQQVSEPPVLKQKKATETIKPTISPPKQPEEPEVEESIKYTVKLGTFSSQKNAENLVNALKSSGHNPWMKSESNETGTVYHVFVGKFDDINKAEEYGRSLQEKSPYITDYIIREVSR